MRKVLRVCRDVKERRARIKELMSLSFSEPEMDKNRDVVEN
jgi:hypothetical protein